MRTTSNTFHKKSYLTNDSMFSDHIKQLSLSNEKSYLASLPESKYKKFLSSCVKTYKLTKLIKNMGFYVWLFENKNGTVSWNQDHYFWSRILMSNGEISNQPFLCSSIFLMHMVCTQAHSSICINSIAPSQYLFSSVLIFWLRIQNGY
jgi:hypothetical protein